MSSDRLFSVSLKHYQTETSDDIRREIFNQISTFGMSDSERANFYGLPSGCRIREGAKIICPEKLRIGTNVWIGENAILDASGGLEIGSNTSIGLGVYVWSHDSSILNRKSLNSREYSNLIRRKKTIIGKNCFISGPSVIMPGATIGNKSIIAPMSIVQTGTQEKEIFTPYREMYELIEKVEILSEEIAKLKGSSS